MENFSLKEQFKLYLRLKNYFIVKNNRLVWSPNKKNFDCRPKFDEFLIYYLYRKKRNWSVDCFI